jgi:hypothetical protein
MNNGKIRTSLSTCITAGSCSSSSNIYKDKINAHSNTARREDEKKKRHIRSTKT